MGQHEMGLEKGNRLFVLADIVSIKWKFALPVQWAISLLACKSFSRVICKELITIYQKSPISHLIHPILPKDCRPRPRSNHVGINTYHIPPMVSRNQYYNGVIQIQ